MSGLWKNNISGGGTSMTKPLPDKKPSLDEILNRAIAVYSEDGKMKAVIQGKLRDEACTAIKALVPEKKDNGYRNDGTSTDILDRLRRNCDFEEGWNACREEMLRRLSGDGLE